MDEIDQNKLEDAKKQCGPNPSQACIFDYLATGDIALAESSGTEEASAQSDKQIIGKECNTAKLQYKHEIFKYIYLIILNNT